MAPYVKVGKYILKKKIGEGAFAEVRLAQHEDTREEFAVKIFDKQILPESTIEKDVRREIKIMKYLRHPNIVSIHAVLMTSTKMYLVMELVKGGELYDEIVSKRRIDEKTSRRYFHQIVDAMTYCHSRGVFHRDLKPENLLVNKGVIKLTDFGMSWMKDVMNPDFQARTLLQTQCGTPKYMPPEIIQRPASGYDGEKLDAWECGMVLYALLAGYLPFSGDNDNEVFRSILKGNIKYPHYFSSGAKDVLSKLLIKDPEKRWSLRQIQCHAWFLVDYIPAVVDEDQPGYDLRKTVSTPGPSHLYSGYQDYSSQPSSVASNPSNRRTSLQEEIQPMFPLLSLDDDDDDSNLNETIIPSTPTPRATQSAFNPFELPVGTQDRRSHGPNAEVRMKPGTRTPKAEQNSDMINESTNSGKKEGGRRGRAPPLKLRTGKNITESTEDLSPMSFKDRIMMSPLGAVFRTMRSAPQHEVDSEEKHDDSSWFAETSPTSIAYHDGKPNSNVNQTEKSTRSPRDDDSSSPFRRNTMGNPVSRGDVATPTSAFRKITSKLNLRNTTNGEGLKE